MRWFGHYVTRSPTSVALWYTYSDTDDEVEPLPQPDVACTCIGPDPTPSPTLSLSPTGIFLEVSSRGQLEKAVNQHHTIVDVVANLSLASPIEIIGTQGLVIKSSVGAEISGGEVTRLFDISAGAEVTFLGLTLADGMENGLSLHDSICNNYGDSSALAKACALYGMSGGVTVSASVVEFVDTLIKSCHSHMSWFGGANSNHGVCWVCMVRRSQRNSFGPLHYWLSTPPC